MKTQWTLCMGLTCVMATLAGVALTRADEPSAEPATAEERTEAASPAAEADGTDADAADAEETDPAGRVSVDAARSRAKVMHDVYASALHMMHERYFHGDRAMVPARALEDVFADIRRQSKTEARWISVNMKPMNIDHEPKIAFEKRAAREIARGTASVEAVEDGFYRLAAAIPLTSGCVNCHGGFFRTPSKKMTPKFTALVISVPVTAETAASDREPAAPEPAE